MTPGRAIDELANSAESALLICTDKNMHHWFMLCQSELQQVRASLVAGQSSGVEKHLKSDQDYFDYAVQKRKMHTDFTVNPNGEASEFA